MMLNNKSSMRIYCKMCKIFLNNKKWMKIVNSFYKKKWENLMWFLKSCINKHKKKSNFIFFM